MTKGSSSFLSGMNEAISRLVRHGVRYTWPVSDPASESETLIRPRVHIYLDSDLHT